MHPRWSTCTVSISIWSYSLVSSKGLIYKSVKQSNSRRKPDSQIEFSRFECLIKSNLFVIRQEATLALMDPIA